MAASGLKRVLLWLVAISCLAVISIVGIGGYVAFEVWRQTRTPRGNDQLLGRNGPSPNQPSPRPKRFNAPEEQGPPPLHSGPISLQTDGSAEIYLADVPPTPERPRAELIGELQGHEGSVLDAELLAHDKQLVTCGLDHTIRLWDLASRQELLQFPKSGGVNDLAVAPDSTTLAAAYADGLVRLWNVADQKQWGELRGHRGPVRCVVYSHDGTKILTGGDDRSVRLWDAASGDSLKVLFGHDGPVLCLAFSSDAAWAVSGSEDRGAIYWDLNAGVVHHFIHLGKPVPCVTLFPDDFRAVLGGDSWTSMWDVKHYEFLGNPSGGSGMPIKSAIVLQSGAITVCGGLEKKLCTRTFPLNDDIDMEKPNHGAIINCVRADASGRLVLSAGEDGLVKLWSFPDLTAASNAVASSVGKSYSLAVSDDGKWVALGGKDVIRLRYSDGDREEEHRLKGHTGFVLGLAFRADGQELLSGGQDKTLRRWSLPDGQGQVIARLDAFGSRVRYSPDERSIVAAVGGKIRFYDATTGELQQSYLGHRSGDVDSLEFLQDGTTLASASSRTAVFWDLASRRETQRYQTGVSEGWPKYVSPDGRFLFTTESNRNEWFVGAWDLESRTEKRRFTGKLDSRPNAFAVAFSEGGGHLFCGVNNGAYCWDLISNKLLFSVAPTRAGISNAVFRKDGRQVYAADMNGVVYHWDVPTSETKGEDLR